MAVCYNVPDKETHTVAPMTYCDMIRSKDHTFDARLRMVKLARSSGLRHTARQFGCSRNTVRLWLRRYEAQGLDGLRDRSRAPKTCPHKTSPSQERAVLTARRKMPCAGPKRLKDLFELKPSQGAIARILRQHKLTARRKTRRARKNDLRAIKARYRPLERLQSDTKPLYDIPAYWPQMTALKLPRQLYTIRDVRSGALFLAFGSELSATYAIMAAKHVLLHLKNHGVELCNTILSTDNGSEFGGTERKERDRGFHHETQLFGLSHRFLPPHTPNAHADVESAHSLIEAEVLDLEEFASHADFVRKITVYQYWWNFARRNYSKGGKTPVEILEENNMNPALLTLNPLDLDAQMRNLKPPPHHLGVGQKLPALPESAQP